MSDKVKWAGSGAGYADRSEPLIERYVLAKVHVNGSTHLGQVIEGGICFKVCNNAHNTILLPVADGKVECEECLHIMKRKGFTINTAVRFDVIP